MIFEAYAKLIRDFPAHCGQLFGISLTKSNSLWLSVDHDAYPYLLFHGQKEDFKNDIQLRSVSVQFSRDCAIESTNGESISDIFTIVKIHENDPDIVRILLRLLEETFRSHEKPYTNNEISIQIKELANLFKQIDDSTKDIIGLWGELYILSRSRHLDTAVRCWCCHKMAKYDYVTSAFVLEVKTTVRNRRKHRFSLEQLRPNADFRVIVASLTTVELSSGYSVTELMEELYDKIDDTELRASFLSKCVLKGGKDIYHSSLKLNVYPDGSSLSMFEASKVPVPLITSNSPIDNVRFDVDLTDVVSLTLYETDIILTFSAN